MSDRLDAMLASYQRAGDVHKSLVDVRFKLLALVPTITAIGVTLLKDHASERLLIGAFGLAISLAITMYEIHNSQLHDAAVHRVRTIETWLDLPAASDVGDRPPRGRFLGLFEVWHDRALGLVYGTSVGAWAGLIAYGIAERSSPAWSQANAWLPLGVALLVAAVVYYEMLRINKETDKAIGPSKRLPDGWLEEEPSL